MIGFIDCNNFYVSCERVGDPSLWNIPVAVLSNNDSCIVSRSQECKALSIPLGVPIHKASTVLREHQVALRSSNYELYGDLSRRLQSLMKEFTDTIESYSIDEVFFKVPEQLSPTAYHHLAGTIASRIRSRLGIPVTVAIAPTKTLAKLVTEQAKKSERSNTVLLSPSLPWDAYSVEQVWGIGYRTVRKLHHSGIYSLREFLNAHPTIIRRIGGINLLRTRYELEGHPCITLEESLDQKHQILSSRSFGERIRDLANLEEAIAHFARIAIHKLEGSKQVTQQLTVFLSTSRKETGIESFQGSRSITLPTPTEHPGTIIKHAKKLLRQIYIPGPRYYRGGIVLQMLSPRDTLPTPTLFNEIAPPEHFPLQQTITQLQQQLGPKSIHLGTLPSKYSRWQSKCQHKSKCFTTQLEEVLTITIE